ncbi:MFS transporter [Streptomyces badius]
MVARVRPGVVLRWAQPLVLLALLGVGAGREMWHVAVALGVFGLAVGALDASMNMLGVSLQHAYGRSIMTGFHAAYSLGGIAGASLAWTGARWELSLLASYPPVVAVLLPAALVGSRWYTEGKGERGRGRTVRTDAVRGREASGGALSC